MVTSGWNTRTGGRIIDELLVRASQVVPIVTVYAVNAHGGRVGSATKVIGSNDACWDTARGLAEAAVRQECDITSLVSELVVDQPRDALTSPALDGVAVLVLDELGACLGAISLVGMNSSHGYALVRGILITRGFCVSDGA